MFSVKIIFSQLIPSLFDRSKRSKTPTHKIKFKDVVFSSSEIEHSSGQPASQSRACHRQHREGQHPRRQRHRPPHRPTPHHRRSTSLEVPGRRGITCYKVRHGLRLKNTRVLPNNIYGG